jgi:hypothetical protein
MIDQAVELSGTHIKAKKVKVGIDGKLIYPS